MSLSSFNDSENDQECFDESENGSSQEYQNKNKKRKNNKRKNKFKISQKLVEFGKSNIKYSNCKSELSSKRGKTQVT